MNNAVGSVLIGRVWRLEDLRNTTRTLNLAIRSEARDLNLDFTNTKQEFDDAVHRCV